MKKFLILPVLMLFVIGVFFLNGCGDSGSSAGGGGGTIVITVSPADIVTIDDIKDIPLSGAGLPPSSEAETETLVGGISAAEDSIDTAVQDAIEGTGKKAVFSGRTAFTTKFKSFKNDIVSRLSKSGSSAYVVMQKADSDSDSFSWNESESITLGAPDFISGTIDYNSVGSYSWTETFESISSSKNKFTNKYADESTDKLTFVDVKPAESEITLNGFMNDNFKCDFTSMTLYNFSAGSIEERSEKGGLAGSYRSGYAVSGDTVKCYIVISMDLKATIDVVLNEAQLVGKTEEEIDDFVDSLFTLEGGATVKVFDAAGVLLRTQTLTAEQIWVMD